MRSLREGFQVKLVELSTTTSRAVVQIGQGGHKIDKHGCRQRLCEDMPVVRVLFVQGRGHEEVSIIHMGEGMEDKGCRDM